MTLAIIRGSFQRLIAQPTSPIRNLVLRLLQEEFHTIERNEPDDEPISVFFDEIFGEEKLKSFESHCH